MTNAKSENEVPEFEFSENFVIRFFQLLAEAPGLIITGLLASVFFVGSVMEFADAFDGVGSLAEFISAFHGYGGVSPDAIAAFLFSFLWGIFVFSLVRGLAPTEE